MYFLDKRANVICNELYRLAITDRVNIPSWNIAKGNFVYPQDAYSLGKFSSFDSKTMHWYGPDEHYWFYTDVKVPECFEGKDLYMYVHTQIDEWDDAKNPQFLLFVNGEIIQGIDMNHRICLIAKNAEAGKEYRIDLQAYTGTLHTEFSLIPEFISIDKEIYDLYWDIVVPLQAFERMDPESKERMELTRAINDTINLLDLRTPYSKEFYDSIKAASKYIHKHIYEDLSGHSDIVASCIGHTHIDVAWWWTVAQTREKVARSFATVLKLMEEYPNYKFMSSQPVLYYFLKQRYPELYEQIKQRVKEGRWEPEGGMWLEADCNLTSGESLVRQFLYGKKFFKDEFGVDNKILWLPDVFGYSAALPQIMKECGIEYFMTTKLAWNQFNKIPNDTFIWEGLDGSTVLTHLITTLGVGQDEKKSFFTTYNGLLHPDAILGAWARYQNKEINNDVLISYGYGDGGGGPTKEMLETSKRMEYGIAGIPRVRQVFAKEYFDELNERVKDSNRLNKWVGELYFEYHRGTLTSMARNKRFNRKSELAMMDLELLLTLADFEYPKQQLDEMWRVILLNQFHDILPGTCIHEVYEVNKIEYEKLSKEIATLENKALETMFNMTSDNVSIINTKGFETNEIVNIGNIEAEALEDAEGNVYPVQDSLVFVKNLPSKGYKTLKKSSLIKHDNTPFNLSGNSLETPFYVAEIDDSGMFTRIYDKANDREMIQSGKRANLMHMYEDKPIYYDNWDIDIYYTEKGWDLDSAESIKWSEPGNVYIKLDIERKISNSTVQQSIYFYADSPRIDFVTHVDWKEHQHLLKVYFPIDVHTDEATFDIQFGNIKRKTHKNTSWDLARFEYCGQKWADVSEGNYGVSLLNDCKYGHSINESCIGLTLIKSGIEPNPVTDQEKHVFTYSLYPHNGTWRNGTVQEAYRLNQPALVYSGGDFGTEYSLASVNKSNIIIETIKRAEDGNGIIVRMYESENSLTKAELTFNMPIASVEECNCLEEKKSDFAFIGNKIPFSIKPYEIKTFRIIPKN